MHRDWKAMHRDWKDRDEKLLIMNKEIIVEQESVTNYNNGDDFQRWKFIYPIPVTDWFILKFSWKLEKLTLESIVTSNNQ